MRVGILTGGGDCPGLNAVIRAVTKSLIHRCGAEEYSGASLVDKRLYERLVRQRGRGRGIIA